MADSGRGVRLFVAVEVCLPAVRELSQMAEAMVPLAQEAGLAVKWVSPANYHVTLQYIGWARPEAIEAIRDRVKEALVGVREFEMPGRSVGAFPSEAEATVLWAGIDDNSKRLSNLAERVGAALEELGFARNKSFNGHVTLGRVKKPGDASAVLLPWSEQAYSKTFVRSVVLFESVLKSTGSSYVERARWRLERDSRRSNRHTGRVQRGSTESQSTQENSSGTPDGPTSRTTGRTTDNGNELKLQNEGQDSDQSVES